MIEEGVGLGYVLNSGKCSSKGRHLICYGVTCGLPTSINNSIFAAAASP